MKINKCIEKLLDKVSREDIERDYCVDFLSKTDIARKYNITESSVSKLLEYFNLERDLPKVRSYKNHITKSAQYESIKKRIKKEDLYQWYIIEDNPYVEGTKHYNITQWMFDKLCSDYGIKKDRHKTSLKSVKTREEKAGGKENYNKQLIENRNKKIVDKYGSVDNYNKKKSQALKDKWNREHNDILSEIYSSKDNLSNISNLEEDTNNKLVVEYFKKCRQIEFPFPCQNIDIEKEYKKILKVDSKNSKSGLSLVYRYHPSLWLANKKTKLSPYKAWYDDRLLIQCIENRLKYKGEILTPDDILYGFSASYIAPKVSIFRPSLAKYLIEKYLNDYDEIFDPCSGYSGRLLGTTSLNKKYIGQDINKKTIEEANKLIEDLHLTNIDLRCKNSLATIGSYETLFTCPPYGEKENWNQDIEILTADEWIDICLSNYKCKKYLFVVDKTEKYKDFIVEEIKNKSHFSQNTEYVILIESQP